MEIQNNVTRKWSTTEEADLSCCNWGDHGCNLELSESGGYVEHFDGVDRVYLHAIGDNQYLAMHGKKPWIIYSTSSLVDMKDWAIEAILSGGGE